MDPSLDSVPSTSVSHHHPSGYTTIVLPIQGPVQQAEKLFRPLRSEEEEGIRLVRNVGNYLPVNTA